MRIYDAGRRDDGACYVVMELVDGESLKSLIKSQRLAPTRTAELLADVADAVHDAHQRGLVHRDLKPDNILIDGRGKPHVADFGLAVHETEQRWRAGEISGTPSYMAPEQVAGQVHQLDGRADIWSLGVVLYELLTCRRPFLGVGVSELFDEIVHRDPKPPRQIHDQIPAELERITLKCLSKPVTERYATAADLAADLRSVLVPQQPPAAGRQSSGRGALLAVPFVLLAVVLWAGSAGSNGQRQSAAGWQPSSRHNCPADCPACDARATRLHDRRIALGS